MKILEARKVSPEVSFDLPTYMALGQTGDITSPELVDIISYWEKWLPMLHAYILGRKKGYLALFMDEAVEKEIDTLWERSNAQGFKLQALVQTMIVCALQNLVPQIGKDQCAPVPEPNKILQRSLAQLGLKFSEQGALNYKYSTLTFYPFREGCQVCYLVSSCPKLNLPKMEGLFRSPE